MNELLDQVNSWCQSGDDFYRDLYSKFNSVYEVHQDIGQIVIPESFQSKVSSWVGNSHTVDDVFHCTDQTITTIHNKVLEEEAVFNSLRLRRPKPENQQSTERAYVENLTEEKRSAGCDFCTYNHNTAEDIEFGRIETEHSITAANVFKIEAWNSMIVFRNHHPIDWSETEFLDAFFSTTTQWFERVQRLSPEHCYPCLVWDLLPNGGASQVHPHIHAILRKNSYPGGLERWRRKMQQYNESHEQLYFDTVIQLHEALGLAVKLDTSTAIMSLTPKKDDEVILVSSRNDVTFYRLLYCVIRTFIDDLKIYGLSLAIALPPMNASTETGGSSPAFGRVVMRGRVNGIQSDVGALDLFTAPSIGSDPFVTVKAIQRRVHEHYSKGQSEIELKLE